MGEAQLKQGEGGLVPASEGWFVVNVRDAEWWTSSAFGSAAAFGTKEFPFRQFGINITVVEPGEPACLYHSENQQEDFLVLHGECMLLIEGEERPLKTWDFVHCPPDVVHVFVGAGEGPCAILMTGARTEDEKILYPVSGLAAKYGASAEEETPDPREAYARFEEPTPERPSYWDALPWS